MSSLVDFWYGGMAAWEGRGRGACGWAARLTSEQLAGCASLGPAKVSRSGARQRQPSDVLEGELADEQLGGLLVSPDLTESHCSGPVSVRLLDSAGGRGGLASSLGGQLLPGGLASGGFTSGLLGTSHGVG